MKGPGAIGLALDLARMPTFATSGAAPALPHDVLELMRVAAGSTQACRAAEAATGAPAQILIEAARFYLQQALFHPEADCYRVLGLQRGASRDLARRHMRWLLQWLHPDRNSGWEGVYAERVVKAWREVSSSNRATFPVEQNYNRNGVTIGPSKARGLPPFRVAWIRRPPENPVLTRLYFRFRLMILAMAAAAGLAIILWLLAALILSQDNSRADTFRPLALGMASNNVIVLAN